MNTQSPIILLAALCLISGLLFVTPARIQEWISAPVTEMVGPIQETSRPLLRRSFTVIGDVLNAWSLADENERLVRRNAHLQTRVAKLEGEYQRLAREIEELRRTGKVLHDGAYAALRAERVGFVPEDAAVIGLDPSSWRRSFFVNVGTRRGVRTGDYVAVGDAVVGMVRRTSRNYSLVLAINDPDFRVAAFVPRNARAGQVEEGVVRGTVSGACELEIVRGRKGMENGDLVYSSGYAGRCPKGLVVGRVVGASGAGPKRRKFRIEPFARGEGLDTVVVLARKQRE